MLKAMENEIEIFRAWLQKYVNTDRCIKGVELAKKIGVSKATVSAYISGRIINDERKFTQIPFDVREKILKATGVTSEDMLAIGRKELQPTSQNYEVTPEKVDVIVAEALKKQLALLSENDLAKYKKEKNAEHHSVINQFQDHDKATKINHILVKLEKMDSDELDIALKHFTERLEYKELKIKDAIKKVGQEENPKNASGE